MKRLKVEFSPGAQFHLIQAIQWYNDQRKGQGKSFFNEVIAILKTITSNPEGFQYRYKDVREAPLRKHPFLVFYSFRRSTVYILAVLHCSQSPGKWPAK